jgi:predicted ribosomally synthesized peptide with nif11-like leader
MSQEQARACIEKMKTDEAFRAKVLAVEDVTARVALINAEGFECSEAEIEAVSAELSEAELNAVSGGVGSPGMPITRPGPRPDRLPGRGGRGIIIVDTCY